MNEPFLVHKANLEKWRPRMYDVKDDYILPEDAKYKVASSWKFYSKESNKSPGGHNMIMELQFAVIRDKLDSYVEETLSTVAGTEVSVLFFDGRPAKTKETLFRFGVLRKKFIPVANTVSRDGEIIKTSFFKFFDSGDDYNGYRFNLDLTYTLDSSRSELLEKQGKVIHIAISQDTMQTTIDQYLR